MREIIKMSRKMKYKWGKDIFLAPEEVTCDRTAGCKCCAELRGKDTII